LMNRLCVILPAAGSSSRFGAGQNKLLSLLGGKPVIRWSVEAFLKREEVISLVIPCSHRAVFAEILPQDPRLIFCEGGDCRARSVKNALKLASPQAQWIAVHDAARPLVSDELVDRVLEAAKETGAAAPAMPVIPTIKQTQGPLPSKVVRTLPRQTLFALQTPQIIVNSRLIEAFESCPIPLGQVTDDTQLVELAGGEVVLVDGETRNIKITEQADLILAEEWMRR
jgi:2-C-methyl-D-erythritol 4-phosphate cytidylyltransferase